MNIQLQDSMPACENLPELLGTLAMIGSIHAATETVWFTSGVEDGPYFNLNIESGDVTLLWPLLHSAITSRVSLGVRVIVTCQGEDGWNDYLLLHHFDESQVIDAFP